MVGKEHPLLMLDVRDSNPDHSISKKNHFFTQIQVALWSWVCVAYMWVTTESRPKKDALYGRPLISLFFTHKFQNKPEKMKMCVREQTGYCYRISARKDIIYPYL